MLEDVVGDDLKLRVYDSTFLSDPIVLGADGFANDVRADVLAPRLVFVPYLWAVIFRVHDINARQSEGSALGLIDLELCSCAMGEIRGEFADDGDVPVICAARDLPGHTPVCDWSCHFIQDHT